MHALRRIASLSICVMLSCAVAGGQMPQLQLPSGLAYDAAGNLYIADTNRNQVLEATLAGTLIVVAGTGTQGFAGDNGLATAAELNAPQGLAIGPDGTLYIADTGNHRIRSVAAGQITTFAGTGTLGFAGDGAAPTAAALRSPTALALDPAGALLICDTGNHRIRRIANGTMMTVAGNGNQGFSGDGGAATSAQLDTPLGIAAFATGAFYIADARNDRVRSVGLDGIIHTVAGTGTRGFSGDGGPAAQAKLALPHGLLISSAGLVVSDANNQRLRLIDSSGKIATLAGTGIEGKATDGDATLSATIDTPTGVALSPFGMISFADSANRMVRVVASNQLFAPAALVSSRVSIITPSTTSPEIYGTATLAVAVSGSVGVPQGDVQLQDGGVILASATLSAGTATLALPTLGAGQHSLTTAYAGDGLNPAATLPTSLSVSQAPSSTVESTPTQNAYATLPVTLSAQVTSTTQSVPTGPVQFMEGTTVIATGQLNAGNVSAVYLNPSVGAHVIQALYGGDHNFQSSGSVTVTLVVQPMPDFILSSTIAAQTVQGGSIATYPITIAAQPGPFSGAVTLSATGLPSAATVTFSPGQVVPGAGAATVQMSVTTPVTVVHHTQPWPKRTTLVALLLFPLLWRVPARRRLDAKRLLSICLSVLLLVSVGCGSRNVAIPASTPLSYAITVVGTSTNLAGLVVMHTTVVQLTVR